MAQLTAQQRRDRMQQVLETAAQWEEFSKQQVQQQCQELSAAYVTKTLTSLVEQGILQRQEQERQIQFRWTIDRSQFAVQQWIDREIHGDQVRELPEQERPRERLLRLGATRLTNAELLAILIRVGVKGQSAITGGRLLANRFDQDLELLRDQTLAELRKVTRAVTQANYCQIMAGIELGRRVALAQQTRPPVVTKITSSDAAMRYCQDQFRHLAHDAVQEEFHIVTLDTKHKPIRTHQITVGTLDASLVHPREVFRAAIRDASSAILLVHNHPSGDPTPSREDHLVTDRLTDAGKLIGITVLDHIIVASERCLSLREVS